MSDIIERLRGDLPPCLGGICRERKEAADEIERLHAALREIAELEMGRGDGVVGDYIGEINDIVTAALK